MPSNVVRCSRCGARLAGPGQPCPACLIRAGVAEIANRGGTEPLTGASAGDSATATRIGPYRTLETLGEGGMGVVYLAEQLEPIRRRVALKVIRVGMDTREVVARFEAERQTLALMDHPNIAAVFDAGTTPAGRPYLVMEYVAGLPITEFCDQRRLSTRDRLGARW